MQLPNVRVVVVLGRIALEGYYRARGLRPVPAFAHGAVYDAPPVRVIASYHPSRQNTNTGRLTEPMFDAIWQQARTKLLRARR